MAEENEPPAPDWRENRLKNRRETAADRAEEALRTLGADVGNPLSSPIQAIENGAWDSPSTERTTFIQDLDGLGSAVKTAFNNAVGDLTAAASSEPEQIDVANDPDNAWKTSDGSIDARVWYHNVF